MDIIKNLVERRSLYFALELPPYCLPNVWTTFTSFIDRTLIVLWRAMIFAEPAGAVIWLTSNIYINDLSIANLTINWIDEFGLFLGLNGVILLAYIVAIPANEIIIPTILMLTMSQLNLTGAGDGVMFELESTKETAALLNAGGWTLLTGINLMLLVCSITHAAPPFIPSITKLKAEMDPICKYNAGNFRIFNNFFGHTNMASISLSINVRIKKKAIL